MIYYIISVIVCLPAYIFINWYDNMDLTLACLALFTMIALVPVANVFFLLYLLKSLNLPTITLLKGKKYENANDY